MNAAAAAAAAVKHTNAHTLRTPKHEGLHIMRRFNTTLPQSKRAKVQYNAPAVKTGRRRSCKRASRPGSRLQYMYVYRDY